MNAKLSAQDAIYLADEYRQKHMKSTLDYQFVKANYLTGENSFSPDSVWEITYDVVNWDDVWYSIIISDTRKKVLCCSSAWAEKFYPHFTKSQKS